jgi:pimeloyl-ACP methyl ester carboxylesterase
MSSTSARATETIELGEAKLDVERRGSGKTTLVLYGEEGLELDAPVLDRLAAKRALVIPSPPGFGTSERPDWVSSPDDIAYIYLDLVAKLRLERADVIGFGLGGWIAAEMATKDQSFINKLVLVDAFGVKIRGPLDRDIQDIWTLNPAKVAAMRWYDQEKGKRDYPSMTTEQLTVIARNSESFARFCWEPYMHNPKLKHRLHRVTRPTLVVWGENDGIVTPAYGKAYAGLIPGARFVSIPRAGHYPHLEQPDAFLEHLNQFLG